MGAKHGGAQGSKSVLKPAHFCLRTASIGSKHGQEPFPFRRQPRGANWRVGGLWQAAASEGGRRRGGRGGGSRRPAGATHLRQGVPRAHGAAGRKRGAARVERVSQSMPTYCTFPGPQGVSAPVPRGKLARRGALGKQQAHEVSSVGEGAAREHARRGQGGAAVRPAGADPPFRGLRWIPCQCRMGAAGSMRGAARVESVSQSLPTYRSGASGGFRASPAG